MAYTAGQTAFYGYLRSSGGRSLVTGEHVPEWEALPPEIREAWEAAAWAVLTPPSS